MCAFFVVYHMGKITKTFSVQPLEIRKEGGRILISTPAVDRDKDRVIPAGVNVENYKRNPVVQWGHSYEEPWQTVGRTTSLKVTPEGIEAEFELRPAANESDPQNIVRLLWEQGYIKAASIGFIPTKAAPNKDGGNDFTESELLEWSLVPIPANQTALRLSMKTAKQKKLLGRALLTKSPDYRLPDETPDACSARKIPELMEANPGMTEDEARAMAAEICAQEAPADQPADAPAPDAPSQDEQANAKAEGDVVAVLDEIEAMFGKLRDLLAPSDAPAPMDEPMQEGKGWSAFGGPHVYLTSPYSYASTGTLTVDASKALTGGTFPLATKRGRVLSAGNEGKLRTAHGAIGEVLSQLGEAAPEQASEAEKGDKAKAAQLMKELAAVLGDLPKIYKK